MGYFVAATYLERVPLFETPRAPPKVRVTGYKVCQNKTFMIRLPSLGHFHQPLFFIMSEKPEKLKIHSLCTLGT